MSETAIAAKILLKSPDPVVRLRLKRDVLDMPAVDLAKEKFELQSNPWVQQLVGEQHANGSWGRFHSRDQKSRQKIITTEFGVARGLALGLDTSHPAFCRTIDYLAQLLSGQVDFPDPSEKNDRWPVVVTLFTAATLAQLKPNHPFLDSTWELWAEIAARTFQIGDYNPEEEAKAFLDLTGVDIKGSYLTINNKYALTLLAARADTLSVDLMSRITNWIWNLPGGVGHHGVALSRLPADLRSSQLDRWFTSHELLSRFPNWYNLAVPIIQWLWAHKGGDGFWDFGKRSAGSHYFPLSPNWRKPFNRKVDWTTRILVLSKNAEIQRA